MSKKDYTKLTPEELKQLTPEEMAEALTALAEEAAAAKGKVATLQKTSEEQQELLKDQAEQLASNEKVSGVNHPVIRHKEGKKERKFVWHLHAKGKFKHKAKDQTTYKTFGLADLERGKNGLSLCLELLEMKSGVISELK